MFIYKIIRNLKKKIKKIKFENKVLEQSNTDCALTIANLHLIIAKKNLKISESINKDLYENRTSEILNHLIQKVDAGNPLTEFEEELLDWVFWIDNGINKPF